MIFRTEKAYEDRFSIDLKIFFVRKIVLKKTIQLTIVSKLGFLYVIFSAKT